MKRINMRRIYAKMRPHGHKSLLVAGALVLLLASQVRTFIKSGEILGYGVRKISKTAESQRKIDRENTDMASKSLACRLSDKKNIEAVTGQKMNQSTLYADSEQKPIVSSCRYTSTDNGSHPEWVVTIALKETANESDAKKEIEGIKVASQDSVSVEGIGDEAYFSQSLGRLTIRSKSRYMNLFVNKADSSRLEALKKIAQKML